MADDVLLPIANDGDDLLSTQRNELFETVREDRSPGYLYHPLWLVLCQRTESGSFTRSEHDCLHESRLQTNI